jgi:hypothetical protein
LTGSRPRRVELRRVHGRGRVHRHLLAENLRGNYLKTGLID